MACTTSREPLRRPAPPRPPTVAQAAATAQTPDAGAHHNRRAGALKAQTVGWFADCLRVRAPTVGLRSFQDFHRLGPPALRCFLGLQGAPHDAKMPKKGTPPRLRLGPCAREPRPGPRWAARPGPEASTGGSLCPMLSAAAAAPGGRRAARGGDVA